MRKPWCIIAQVIARSGVSCRSHGLDPPSRRDPCRRCGGLFASDGGRRGGHARTPQGASAGAARSEDRGAASSRIPATACWRNSQASSTRCVAPPKSKRGMIDREPEVADERRIRFRIGINLGDVIAEDDDIFGDGVNVAARLEPLAEPGGICISRTVRDQNPRQAALSVRGQGRAERQEYRSPRAGLRVAPRSHCQTVGCDDAASHANLAAHRRATPVDRRAAVCQLEQRPRAAIFRRRDHRGCDNRSVAARAHVRDLAEHRLHLP